MRNKGVDRRQAKGEKCEENYGVDFHINKFYEIMKSAQHLNFYFSFAKTWPMKFDPKHLFGQHFRCVCRLEWSGVRADDLKESAGIIIKLFSDNFL